MPTIFTQVIVEYYDSVNESYNILTGNGYDGQITMLPIAMPDDGGGSVSGNSGGGNSGDVVHAENYYIVNSSEPSYKFYTDGLMSDGVHASRCCRDSLF